jgi:hypothetical protein
LALRPQTPQTMQEKAAAAQDAQAGAFVREVDDALAEAEFLDKIKRYGKQAGMAAAAGLVVLAGGLWWNNHRDATKEARAEQFILALDKVDGGDPAAGSAQLSALVNDGAGGSKAAAQMMQAALALKQGKTDEAGGIYAAVASDSSAPQPFRDLANIRFAAVRYDLIKPEDVIARLKPLAVPGNPWFGSAGELVAMAYVKQGRKDLAAPLFGAIAKDKDAPESLRARARQMAGLLGVDTVDDIAKNPENEAGSATN